MRERAGGEEERVGWGRRRESASERERESRREGRERERGAKRGKKGSEEREEGGPPPTCLTDRQDKHDRDTRNIQTATNGNKG